MVVGEHELRSDELLSDDMDFDQHRVKDVESLRREEWVSSTPVQPHQSANHSSDCRIPPIKPRRSLKVPKTPRDGAEPIHQSANDQKNETVVKKMSPALTLGSPGPLEPLSPSLRAHTLLWFERSQLPRLRQPGQPLPCWLHGFATRREAEELLKAKPQGCFLLRLSESKIGFVLSYRGKDRCRHFIVEEEEEGGSNEKGWSYLIAGEESRHGSLQELITYYTQNPVGPFDEMLTTTCGDSNGVCTDTVKLEDKASAKAANLSEKEAPLSLLSKAVVPEPATVVLATSDPDDNDVTAQYAVVRKALKKSRSLTESQLGELIPPSRGEDLNVPNCVPEDDSAKPGHSSAGACGGDGFAADVQYARVNKPPRLQALPPDNTSPYININTFSEQQGALESSVPLAPRGSTGDPGYWKLEPLHTYEETPHLTQRGPESQGQIDFYAMGRWRDIEGNADQTRRPISPSGDSSQHHLYSEVNLRGSREAPPGLIPSLGRAAPSLPSRPPPTAVNCPSQLEAVAQRGEDPLLVSSPSRHGVFLPLLPQRPATHDSGSSVYQQILERPVAGSRPPLPPPNPKRNS